MPAPAPISPELVLVDPELAAAARMRLPDPGTAWWRAGHEAAAPVAAAPRVARAQSTPTVVGTERRSERVGRGAARTLVLWCVGLALATVGLGLAADVVREPAAFESSTGGVTRGQPTSRIPSVAWAPNDRASYYRVELFRGGRRVLVVRTHRTSLAPTGKWEPGRYHWLVRPALRDGNRVRLGPPIADVDVVVPGA